jgi:hypothetical protein
MDTEILPTIVAAIFVTAIASVFSKRFFPLLEEQRERREKRRTHIRALLQKKIDANIELSIKDVIDVGHGAGVSSASTTDALYELFSEAADERLHKQLRKLIDDLHRDEPFEGYPAEVRPSMARIAALCEASPQSSDRELMHPLKKILEEYVTMKSDHQTMKKQNRISYAIAIISFFIGVVGLIFAFTGPSKDFISSEIRKALKENLPNKALEPMPTSVTDAAAQPPRQP